MLGMRIDNKKVKLELEKMKKSLNLSACNKLFDED
jgi:hypothetical protein